MLTNVQAVMLMFALLIMMALITGISLGITIGYNIKQKTGITLQEADCDE